MAKAPADFRKRVAAAMAASPLEDALYSQAGRAIINLSNVEKLMAVMFAVLSLPVEVEEANKVFYEQRTFERRLTLLNYAVLKWNVPGEIKAWRAIYQKLKTHKGIRNLIAHQGLFRHPPDESGVRAVSLQPPWYNEKSKGRSVEAKEIGATADALKEITIDLWVLIRKTGLPG
jgi:hypothetical protein